MFEVGKRYRNGCGSACIVLAATDQKAIVEVNAPSKTSAYQVGQQIMLDHHDPFSTWKEYHEPVVVKSIRYVATSKKDPTEPVWTTKGENTFSVGKVEFTVTDGKLTDVRIV